MHNCHIIILAAGKGSRMKSDLPKVMHQIGGVPMLSKVIESASKISDDITIVYSDSLVPYLSQYQDYKLVLQDEPLGTAHAVFCALNAKMSGKILVLYADNPFLSSGVMSSLLRHLEEQKADIASLAFITEKPEGYGRIISDKDGNFIKIQECKEATALEKQVKLCNSGIIAFAPGVARKVLSIIMQERSHKEYYLTDAIFVATALGRRVTFMVADNNNEVIGVNTREELQAARAIIGLT
jgi:UDP-N-acetylglucosamine pyrophosphorylase